MVMIILASFLLSVIFIAICAKKNEPVFLIPLMVFIPSLVIAGISLCFSINTHNQIIQKLEHPEIFKRSLEVAVWNDKVVKVKANPWLYKWSVWDRAEYIVEEQE